jgi:hypothetical protein
MSNALPLTNAERTRYFQLDEKNNMEPGITPAEKLEFEELNKRFPIRRWPPFIPPQGTLPPTIIIGKPTPAQQIVSVGGDAPVA